MRLMWFEDTDNSHVFLFNTNADLPRVGEYVYIRDYDNHGQTNSYRVTDVIHSITRSTLSKEVVEDRMSEFRHTNTVDWYQKLVDLLEKDMGGIVHPGLTHGSFGLIRQHAEVIIKKEKDDARI